MSGPYILEAERIELLIKYTDRAPIAMERPGNMLFSHHFLFAYFLICECRYREAKDSLKALLLYLRESSESVVQDIFNQLGVGQGEKKAHEKLNQKKTGQKKKAYETGSKNIKASFVNTFNKIDHRYASCLEAIVSLKLHIYNLISFCHLYLGDYAELDYYLVQGINLGGCSAFRRRKALVAFIAESGEPPDLDVWVEELRFLGGFYVKNINSMKSITLEKYFTDILLSN